VIRRLTTRPVRPCIGVDPGSGPGAVAVWTPDGGWRVRGWKRWEGEGERVVREALDGIEGADAAVELITPHAGKGRGLLKLAVAADLAVRAVQPHALKVLRPSPTRWRYDVLGLSPRTGAPECEKAAIAAVAGVPRGGRYVVDLGVGLTLGGHEAEAVCLALWAAGCRLGEPEVQS
jgi:hypothetical protein